MVDDVIAVTIEGRRQPPLRDRHADAVADTLPERSRRHLDAGRASALRMPGRSTPPLPELLEIFHREVVAGQKQQTVEQRARVPGREDEPVAVGPCRILRIVPQVARPQDVGHRRRAHRHTGVPGVCFLNRVDREHPDGVDTELFLICHPRHLATSIVQISQASDRDETLARWDSWRALLNRRRCAVSDGFGRPIPRATVMLVNPLLLLTIELCRRVVPRRVLDRLTSQTDRDVRV